jgi:hypothetical protein
MDDNEKHQKVVDQLSKAQSKEELEKIVSNNPYLNTDTRTQNLISIKRGSFDRKAK